MMMWSEGRARPPAEPLNAAERLGEDASPYLPQRKLLGHTIPTWVEDGAVFFVTICAARRKGEPLLKGDSPGKLIETVRFLHDRGEWFARLFLIMPDHVHGLIAVPSGTSLMQRISAWKGYTHKTLQIEWQERFFDHRLRSDESLDEKAGYIRMNPVRAGLVSRPEQWRYVFDAYSADGSAGRLALPLT